MHVSPLDSISLPSSSACWAVVQHPCKEMGGQKAESKNERQELNGSWFWPLMTTPEGNSAHQLFLLIPLLHLSFGVPGARDYRQACKVLVVASRSSIKERKKVRTLPFTRIHELKVGIVLLQRRANDTCRGACSTVIESTSLFWKILPSFSRPSPSPHTTQLTKPEWLRK